METSVGTVVGNFNLIERLHKTINALTLLIFFTTNTVDVTNLITVEFLMFIKLQFTANVKIVFYLN
jgi:hypothetical protein